MRAWVTQPAVLALTGACVLGACATRREAVGDRVSIVLDASAERRMALRDLVIEPTDNVKSARIDARGVIAIERVDQARTLRLSAPNLCPVQVPPGPQPDALELKPVLSLGGDRTGIGFGTRFTVQAQLHCGEAGRIHWQQLEGPPLSDLQVTDEGFTLSARTAYASLLAAAPTGANTAHPQNAANGGDVEVIAHAQSARSEAEDASRAAISPSVRVQRSQHAAESGDVEVIAHAQSARSEAEDASRAAISPGAQIERSQRAAEGGDVEVNAHAQSARSEAEDAARAGTSPGARVERSQHAAESGDVGVNAHAQSARSGAEDAARAAISPAVRVERSQHAAEGGDLGVIAREHSAARQARGATRAAKSSSAQGERAGIVPISPRTQGRVVLEARWEGAGLPPATRQVVISAAARSTGLSSVAVSQPLVLAGDGWSVQTRPAGHAAVKTLQGLTFFAADAPGSWTLSKQDGSTLKLQALTHDATPYDCGRAECHASLSEHTAESPMSHALERPLAGLADSAAVSCMLDCHVLGERGLSDGGFLAVSARLGFTWTEHTRWQDLPQALRRAGAVRCTACHGPGAIPPPEQRSAILESDVCATCHDAPPRYVHVTQWRSSRMASADRDPATRAPECARCHTTSGFLAHNGVRKLSDEAPRATPTGIACAACHAPHSPNRGPRLIRNLDPTTTPTGDLFPEPATTLCRTCHAPLTSPDAITSQTARAHEGELPSAQESQLRASTSAQAAPEQAREMQLAHESAPRAMPAAPGQAREMLTAEKSAPRAMPAVPAQEREMQLAHESAPRAMPAAPGQAREMLTAEKSAPRAMPAVPAQERERLSAHESAPRAMPAAPGQAREMLTAEKSATHTSLSASVAPSGTLFASVAAVPAQDGAGWELVSTRSAHAQVPRGCIGCHGGGALQTGAIDHSFRVEPRVCATCHADDALQAGRTASAELRARALTLSRALAPHCQSSSRSPHPQLMASCKDTALQRAAYETNLVLDDNAALFHNADLSRALLDDAERILRAFRGL